MIISNPSGTPMWSNRRHNESSGALIPDGLNKCSGSVWTRSLFCAAILAAVTVPAIAAPDEVSELKAAIAAQKEAAAAQQARLDALEARLNHVQAHSTEEASAAVSPTVPPATPAGLKYKQGDGLTFTSGDGRGNVTLYGLIDISYVHTDHATPTGGSITAPRVAWFSGNRWGLTGRRALGDTGLNTIFRLESEFESQTGDMDTPGTLFNRDAWVGLESKSLGKLTFGRQNAIGRDPGASAIYENPYNQAVPSTDEGGGTNNNDFKQLIFYAGSPTGTRIDNGVVWKKVWDSGFVTGLQYQFGGVAGDFATGSSKTASLAYAGGFFNLAGFVTSAQVGQFINRTYSMGGNFTTGPFRFNAGVYHYTAEQGALRDRKDNAYTVSTKFAPVGKLDYELGYQVMRANNAAVTSAGNVLNAFSNPIAAKATATGSRANVYASSFYHFDKITEVYVAADYLKLMGRYKFAPTNGFANQTELAVGMRTKF